MIEPHIDAIATLDTPQDAALLALNNAHAKETSFLSEDQWRSMIAGAFTAACVGGTSALLIAFDQDAQYANPNFEWFGERWSRFVYIDRVIVAEDHRGEGLARLLYGNLFERMKDTGHQRVGCEVNLDPPNPGSDAFHSKLGFVEQGRAALGDRSRVVRYLAKELD